MAKNFKITLDPDYVTPTSSGNYADELWKFISGIDVTDASVGCACEGQGREDLVQILDAVSQLASTAEILAGLLESIREEI